MTIDDDKFQDFIRFYANYRETNEDWAQKVQRFRESKLYASMAKSEDIDAALPIDEKLEFEDGSIHNPSPQTTFLILHQKTT